MHIHNALFSALFLSLSLSGTGCAVLLGDEAGDDTGAASDDGAGATVEGASDDGSVWEVGLTQLPDPCDGQGTPEAMVFPIAGDGWIGCGNGMGLWRSADGGESWTRGHPSADLYVFSLAFSADGALLACGHDYEYSAQDALLYRLDGAEWTALLRYGDNRSDPAAAYLSNCGAVAARGDGTLLVASNTSGDMSWSYDDGATWSAAERYWEDTNLDPGGYAAYTMLNLKAAGGAYYGAGSTITAPPTFYTPTLHADGDFMNFHAWTVTDRVVGEVWAMATPDDGATWFVGGRDQGATRRSSGFLYASTDGGQSWSGGGLPEGLDVVHDLAFSPDGRHGVAVGHRYPTSDGGFVLLSEDGGQSWTELPVSLPLLQSAAADDERFWVAGDAFVARASF